MFMNNLFLGVRLFIWFYFLISIISFSSIIIYYYREKIRSRYYNFRFPEKVIKVTIHYPNNQFKEFVRLIPTDSYFILEGFRYCYSDPRVINDNEFFAQGDKNRNIVSVQGKKYELQDLGIIKKRKNVMSEIHYFFNNPKPIIFDCKKENLILSSEELTLFKDNDLFAKLLTLETEKALLIFCLILGVINILVSVFILAKIMGWLDKKK